MIKVRSLNVQLGAFALRDVTLDVEQGEYCVILGPTGAGKTVLLESIAGLNAVKQGDIWLAGRNITRLPPEERHISIVYQDQALFPHLSVRENITFALSLRGQKGIDKEAALHWLAGLLDISDLLARGPSRLSGGEKQKVALARALSIKPQVLLLDEPLGALDPQARENMQQELVRLHRTLGITIMHVTHDFEEGIALGQRMAVMAEGRIEQVGTPEQIFYHPCSERVARFTGIPNVFTGRVVSNGADGSSVFRSGALELRVKNGRSAATQAVVRPEDAIISAPGSNIAAPNSFRGRISSINDRGAMVYIKVDVPPVFACLLSRRSFMEMGLENGKEVCISISENAVHLI